MMKDSTNGGCACTPNQSIKCTVTNCAHHCQDQNYCGLNAITVGTHETNPTKVECTDCESFRMRWPDGSGPSFPEPYMLGGCL